MRDNSPCRRLQHLVPWREHRVELIVSVRSVSLVYFTLPAIRLDLLGSHGR